MGIDFSSIDRSIVLFLNSLRNDFFDLTMNAISSFWLWIPLLFYAGYILLKNFNLKSKKSIILNILIILLFAFFQFLICIQFAPSLFESIVDQLRPSNNQYTSMFLDFRRNSYEPRPGLFSPRACLAFSVATFLYFSLWDKDKLLKIGFIVLAILISFSRIYLGYFYPGDVLVSALIGIAIGAVSYPLFFSVKNSALAI